jgi:hypothetical protein
VAVPEGFQNNSGEKPMHKDFGKTPAYIEKYKQEAQVKVEEK